jgi:SAM-dependent methyltransferase
MGARLAGAVALTSTQLPARSTFQGLTQVVRYNWPLYATAGAVAFAALLVPVWGVVPHPLLLAIQIGAAVAMFWTFSSSLVTFYVYDRSELYRWQWLVAALQGDPQRWAAFHAGVDEASEAIRALYPHSHGEVFDVYDSRKMSEASIVRARTIDAAASNVRKADSDALPLADAQIDVAFLIFAAHEIREPADRVRFFRELRRILVAGGCIVLVEHLRDGWNFAAYGPGFMHFLSRAEWTRVATESGFSLHVERTVTPFVRCFIFKSMAR